MKRWLKVLRVAGIALVALALVAALGLFVASMKANARQVVHYESHREPSVQLLAERPGRPAAGCGPRRTRKPAGATNESVKDVLDARHPHL